MRFIIIYKIGQSRREDIIEAVDLESATARASEIRPTWQDVRYQNYEQLLHPAITA